MELDALAVVVVVVGIVLVVSVAWTAGVIIYGLFQPATD